jgi:hypothetical protein
MRKPTFFFTMVAVGALSVVISGCGVDEPEAPRDGSAAVLGVGDPAPDFQLPSALGGDVSLAEFRSRKPVLLYFSMGPG